MDPQLIHILQAASSVFASLIMLAALVLLWWKSHSPWLLLAIAGEGISFLFRLAFSVAAGAMTSFPILLVFWAATGLLTAAGLLGYAIDESNKRS
jgi:hypothetical protein